MDIALDGDLDRGYTASFSKLDRNLLLILEHACTVVAPT